MDEKIPLKGVVLDAPDPGELARFYCRLLGWELDADEEGWATAIGPEGSTKFVVPGRARVPGSDLAELRGSAADAVASRLPGQ